MSDFKFSVGDRVTFSSGLTHGEEWTGTVDTDARRGGRYGMVVYYYVRLADGRQILAQEVTMRPAAAREPRA